MRMWSREPEPTGPELPGYRFEGQLGEGGMGIVYRAVQTSLERPVAVKVLHPYLAANPDFAVRFEREARVMGRVDSEYVVRIYAFEQHRGQCYLVMQLLEGETLAQRLERGPLPLDQAVREVGDAAQGLAAVHALGTVHRDVKPGNLFLLKNGRTVVSDFGIAGVDEPVGARRAPLTPAGVVMGTPEYAAPEQCLGRKAGPAADQYALAVVLFELLTGELPYTGTSGEITVAKAGQPPPALSSLRPEYSRLDPVLARALAQRPEARYGGVLEFHAALQALLAEPDEAVGDAPDVTLPETVEECWRVLEVKPGATLAELRRAYQDLVLVWHPDRLPEIRRPRAAAKLKGTEQN